MKETAGKAVARRWFYQNYLPSLLSPTALRASNFLVLLGEDFRELPFLEELGVPLYRVFSIEHDLKIYKKQRAKVRRDDLEVVLYPGELSQYIQDYLRQEHRISVFNLDICGSYLQGIDPALGKLLLFARRNPSTVIATYSTAGRDRPQLMEGLKSLVVLLWLAPEVIDRLVRHIYSYYRSAELSGDGRRDRDEVSANMLLRHLFWFRSHMERILVGSYEMDAMSFEVASEAVATLDRVWLEFLEKATFPLTYEAVMDLVLGMPRPDLGDVRMDMSFRDVQSLTYLANDTFYHNCYFATFDYDGSSLSLNNWLVESAKDLRSNGIVLVDGDGEPYPSAHGQVAVHTDKAVVWSKDDLSPDLRSIVLPPKIQEPKAKQEANVEVSVNHELSQETIDQIHVLARGDRSLKARDISEKLSLSKVPLPKIAAQVSVARRKA